MSNTIQDYPELAANGDTVVVVWQDNRTGMQDCYMSLSVEGISNLQSSISFTDTNLIGQRLDPDVAYMNGQIHLVYLDYTQHKIVYVKASFGLLNSTNNLINNSIKNISIFDVLGRKKIGKKNRMLFRIYDDGTVEKRIEIE